VSGNRSARHGFGADEYLPHGEILQTRTDIARETVFQQAATRTSAAGIQFRRRGSLGCSA
jgi:hypothetical protein